MISDDFLPAATGVGIYIQRVAAELAGRGHHVSVITTRRRGEASFEIWNGVRVYRTFTLKIFGFYQALPRVGTIRHILEENEVEIVHYHYLGFLLMRTYKAARGMAVRHLYTYHMTVEHLTQPLPMKPLRPLLFRLHVRYCNRFDRILAPSRALIRRIHQFGIHTPAHFLSNPAAFEDLDRPTRPSSHDMFVVLYVGRLDPEKNIPYLLTAFAEFAKDHTACELRIAGEGSQKDHLTKLARTLGIASRVRFLGFVKHSDLAQHYSDADVFVLPSLIEAQPMVVIEAMHFAKPVIVTRQMVSAEELVADGESGFIVDADNAADLAGKLARLEGDKALREKLGRNAQLRSRGYGLSAIIDDLEGEYADLLQR